MISKRNCWGIECHPDQLIGKGMFGWPNGSWEEGLMIALFPTRKEARLKLHSYRVKYSYPKARVVKVFVELKWEDK